MPEITWWGHATVTVAESGVRVLTDPVLTATVGHLRRRRGPVPGPSALLADVVLVSHLHGDHLHLRSLARLPADVPIVVPAGAPRAVPAMRRLSDRDVVEVVPGDEVHLGAVRIEVVPARHDGRRHPLSPRAVTPVGYLVHGAARTYFAGDTDLFPELAALSGRCDVALLPVGGWGPGLGPGHLDPVRAARAAEVLGVGHAVPIHFGTLWPFGLDRVRPAEFLRPGRDFAGHVARLGGATEVHELDPGRSRELPAPGPARPARPSATPTGRRGEGGR